MSLLDVQDVLLDPDFQAPPGSLSCVRTTQTVGDGGTVVSTQQTIQFRGVVYPDRSVNLDLQPDASRVSSRIRIATRYRLQTVTDANAADVVNWRGRRYIVQVVEDYTHFGAGWVVATCTQLDMASEVLR